MRGGAERAYPDSVRRVRPPNTTMPKTLAALPRSQYATLLELVSGKELLFVFDFASSLGRRSRATSTVVAATGACLLGLLLLLRLKTEAAWRRIEVGGARFGFADEVERPKPQDRAA